MLIDDQMARSGAWLFRWRGYLPLAVLPFVLLAATSGEPVEAALGETWGDLYEGVALAVIGAGQALRIATVGFVPRGTSGRNAAAGQVAEVLNTTGLYSIVRNPLYVGNCLMYVGVALFAQSLVLAVILGLVLIPYYERIIASEERFLRDRFGAVYEAWAAETPAFIPAPRLWVAPGLRFSWRSVVRREQASVLGAVTAIYLIALGQHVWSGEQAVEGTPWDLHATMAAAIALKTVALVLKRKTRLLDDDGR